jgi:hypothetical protein
MRIAHIILTAVLLSTSAVHAADAPKALTAQRQRIESADYRASGQLVYVHAKGKGFSYYSYPITIKAHWFPGVLRVLVEIGTVSKAGTDSSLSTPVPVHILLEMRPNGPNEVKIAHPGDANPAILPFDKWSEGLLGTNFSYEDFLEAQYFWAEQAALGEKKIGGRDFDVVKSTPGTTDLTHYTEVTTWFDHTIGFPVYVDKTLKGGTVKEFTSFGLRQEGGVWSAHQIEAKISGQTGSSLLIIDHGTPKAKLSEKDFSDAQMMQFQDTK